MMHHQKTRSVLTPRSSAAAPYVAEGRPGQRIADGASRKRSILRWILLLVLILPW
jgi:hypothetical protein